MGLRALVLLLGLLAELAWEFYENCDRYLPRGQLGVSPGVIW